MRITQVPKGGIAWCAAAVMMQACVVEGGADAESVGEAQAALAVGSACTYDVQCTNSFCCQNGGDKRCAYCCDDGDCGILQDCTADCCGGQWWEKGCCLPGRYYSGETQTCYTTYGTCIGTCIGK